MMRYRIPYWFLYIIVFLFSINFLNIPSIQAADTYNYGAITEGTTRTKPGEGEKPFSFQSGCVENDQFECNSLELAVLVDCLHSQSLMFTDAFTQFYAGELVWSYTDSDGNVFSTYRAFITCESEINFYQFYEDNSTGSNDVTFSDNVIVEKCDASKRDLSGLNETDNRMFYVTVIVENVSEPGQKASERLLAEENKTDTYHNYVFYRFSTDTEEIYCGSVGSFDAMAANDNYNLQIAFDINGDRINEGSDVGIFYYNESTKTFTGTFWERTNN